MHQTKLIRLYKTLTKEELKQFKKWVVSPVHNQHPKVIQLFDFIARRKVLTTISLKKERAFKALYKSKLYDVYTLNHIISYAYEVLVQFIDYLEAVQQEEWQKINTLRALKKRRLIKEAQKMFLKLKEQQLKSSLRNGDYYLHAFVMEVEHFELNGTQNRSDGNNLGILLEQLTSFYSITVLQYACIATTHTNVYKTSYNIPMLTTILELAKTSTKPVVQLYYWAYQALNYPQDASYYKALKQHFYQHNELLALKERRDILLICINYAIKQFNIGIFSFVQEAFSWYQFGLENGFLLDKGQLSQYAYKNIVGIAIKVQAFDWVVEFIDNYTSCLAEGIQQNYSHFAKAKYHFAQQEYDACKLLLIQMEYDDLFLNIDSKIMLLKIYYEENSYNALDALLHSFGVFLNRKELMSYHKNNYKNLIAFTQKLYRSSTLNKIKATKLKRQIEQATPLTEREWLLEKLEELTWSF